MSDIATKRKDQVTRTERELAALEAAEQGATTEPKPKPKPKPKEKKGVGKDNTSANKEAQLRALRAKLKAALAAQNMSFAEKVRAQIATVEGTQK